MNIIINNVTGMECTSNVMQENMDTKLLFFPISVQQRTTTTKPQYEV